MPTGYTADVGDGKVVDFAEFAMQCARAFGALITMRDEPADAAIPDEFAPRPYHKRELEKAEKKLIEVGERTAVQWLDLHREAVVEASRRRREIRAKRLATRERYEAMLAEAQAWTPPSEDHIGLRDFMIEQLTGSIKFDCGDIDYPKTPGLFTEWLEAQMAEAQRDVDYHAKHWAEDVERAAKRSAWVRALRASLEGVSR